MHKLIFSQVGYSRVGVAINDVGSLVSSIVAVIAIVVPYSENRQAESNGGKTETSDDFRNLVPS